MAVRIVLYILFLFNTHICKASFVFHENTYIKFVPEYGVTDNYFGYSTFLCTDGLFVGAPKALNEFTKKPNVTTGMIYICSLRNLTAKLIVCSRLLRAKRFDNNKILNIKNHELMEDSWFGSSMAAIEDKLLITAPRVTSNGKYEKPLALLQGASYLVMRNRFRPLEPLKDDSKIRYQLYSLNGTRPSYGTNTYYYSLGQFGFSMAVTKMNTILFGAPGLLKSAGAIISYTFNPDDRNMQTYLQSITNPYNTMDLDPDDNFGYSVASGIFTINGSVLYVGGAPRARLARGKVLVIAVQKPKYKDPKADELESNQPLDIKAKLIGPQVGSYFGASLCCTDINGDGLDDLLVGAPTFVKNDDNLPYDQGAVFIYMTEQVESGFILKPSGYVSGSGVDAARFGTAISDLGDVDGDGFRDIAIGAPWEDNGVGAVYIYMGFEKGLKTDKVQKIQPLDARGFGWSVSKGVDIDNNTCRDLVIGAYDSGAAYLYRCVPTMYVRTSISVPRDNKVNLPMNTSTFTAMFCVSSPPIEPHVKLNLIGRIKSDPKDNRSNVIGDTEYPITITPGGEICNEKTINVDVTADLSKPIILMFELEADELMKDNSTMFMMEAARISDNSMLNVTLPVQIMHDCGDDLFCSPWLNISLEALDNPYIPGTAKRFGFKFTAWNLEEPAYGLKIIFSLPLHPKRIPSECSFQSLAMTCNMPQPFVRGEIIVWEIEMEYNLNTSKPISLVVSAELSDRFLRSNITTDNVTQVIIDVKPEANFSISGKSLPNDRITISRSTLAVAANLSLQHIFAITNQGPSDWHELTGHIWIPDKAHFAADIKGCTRNDTEYTCQWSIPAHVSLPVTISIQIDLSLEGNYLKRHLKYNATSSIVIEVNQNKLQHKFMGYEVTTALILEPANLLWWIIVLCVLIGLLLLVLIVRILYKCGFFLRTRVQIMKNVETVDSYKTIQTSDAEPASQREQRYESENLEAEKNCEAKVSVDTKRSSYHVLKNFIE